MSIIFLPEIALQEHFVTLEIGDGKLIKIPLIFHFNFSKFDTIVITDRLYREKMFFDCQPFLFAEKYLMTSIIRRHILFLYNRYQNNRLSYLSRSISKNILRKTICAPSDNLIKNIKYQP